MSLMFDMGLSRLLEVAGGVGNFLVVEFEGVFGKGNLYSE